MSRGAAAATSKENVTGRERQAKAVELRIQGWTLERIRDELGYRSVSSVHEGITAQLKRREKPGADELAAIHMAQLDRAAALVMGPIQRALDGGRALGPKQISAMVLSLTRILAQQAKYVDVYSEGQGLGPVVSLLEQLMASPPAGVDPDDPMTITSETVTDN
jgi:hypothetical protein